MEKTIGFRAVKHPPFVGAGYFDAVQTTVTGGDLSTGAMKGSTEELQFGTHYLSRPNKRALISCTSAT